MPSRHRIVSGQAILAAHATGTGDAVVFLHAGVADSRMWRAQLEGVGARHRAIAYDRRGFGETRAGQEDFSAVADLMAVIDATTAGAPPILVGCSEGGRIAIDAALLHPSRIRGLVLIAPGVSGAPAPAYPPPIAALMAQLTQARERRDLDAVIAIRASLFLDGPLASRPRVAGDARALFTAMNATALRSPPVGANLDVAPAFHRLHEISVPVHVIWGDLDFPNIQARSRHVAAAVANGSGEALTGAAHLPSLERPADITRRLAAFAAGLR
ncbi:MAG: alpha/beta fold hydrolase [Janthinobacterium lividum]